jgi:hypothetical protein
MLPSLCKQINDSVSVLRKWNAEIHIVGETFNGTPQNLNLCDFLTTQQSLVDAYKDITFPQNASIRFDRRFKGLPSKDELIRYIKAAAKVDMQELVVSMTTSIVSKTNG